MPKGGARPGAGRPKGKRNKRTEEQAKEVEESGLTPLEYLLSVMRAPVPPELQEKIEAESLDSKALSALSDWHDKRMEAAKSAAPYVHAKLSSVEMDARHTFGHEDALDELDGEGEEGTESPEG